MIAMSHAVLLCPVTVVCSGFQVGELILGKIKEDALECTLVKFLDDTKLGGNSLYAWGQGCHPEGPRPAEQTNREKSYEIQRRQMQIPAHQKEEPFATIQAGDQLAGEQFCGKGSY